MGVYVLRRLVLLVPTFLVVTLLVFAVTRMLPGGPIEAMAIGDGQHPIEVPAAVRAALNEQFGLDQPIPVAYSRWLGDLLVGDLGRSYKYNAPVLEVILARLPTSAWFGLLGFVLAYLVCVPLGIAKAIRSGAPFDVGTSALVLAAHSIPGWALGGMLLVVFGSVLDWFPLGGLRSPEAEGLSPLGRAADVVHHSVLPVTAYAAGSFATLTALVKNSMLDALAAEYIRTAYAKGVGDWRVLFAHALRNAVIPLCTGLGRALAVLAAGSYLIEKVFNIPGIGYLGYTALALDHDYPVVMGILVFNTVLALLGNLVSDLLYAWADPRVRLDA